MEQDDLYLILMKYLDDVTIKDQSEKDLIQDVVAEYIYFLMRMGNVPQFSLDTLEQDLMEETVEMYRKKTYGSYNLQHYRDKKSRDS